METKVYELYPTPSFNRSCAKSLSTEEVLSLGKRLSLDPHCGKPLLNEVLSIKQLRHPQDRTPKSGRPIIALYCVDETNKRVVLIDLVEDGPTLQAWLDDPVNVSRMAKYGRAFLRVITELLLEAS